MEASTRKKNAQNIACFNANMNIYSNFIGAMVFTVIAIFAKNIRLSDEFTQKRVFMYVCAAATAAVEFHFFNQDIV